MQKQEDAFCALLDAADEYLKIREQLDQLLKAGHLNIARARYALGPGAIGQTAYSWHMQASMRTDVALRDEQPFHIAQHSSSTKSAQPSQSSSAKDDPVESQASKSAGPETSASVDSATSTETGANSAGKQPVQQAASEYSSSAIAELAAKFDTNHLDSTHASGTKSASDPLKWFGFMAPQPLRQAQTDFTKAAGLSVQLANVQYRISTSLSTLNHAASNTEHSAS